MKRVGPEDIIKITEELGIEYAICYFKKLPRWGEFLVADILFE